MALLQESATHSEFQLPTAEATHMLIPYGCFSA